MPGRKETTPSPASGGGSEAKHKASAFPAASASPGAGQNAQNRPLVLPDIEEGLLPIHRSLGSTEKPVYRPALPGTGRLHYCDARAGVDLWKDVALLALLSTESRTIPGARSSLSREKSRIWMTNPMAGDLRRTAG